MKGIVFSLSKPRRRRFSLGIPDGSLPRLIRQNAAVLGFVLLLLSGLAVGAVYCRGASEEFISSLDFLFTTNLEARLSHSALATFCACFASDFLFLAAVYLFGCAPWGLPFELFAVFFKGFGTGITAAYLFRSYKLSGAGFYLLVLLPGTFLFCVALVRFASSAFYSSTQSFLSAVSKSAPQYSPRERLKVYSTRFLYALISALVASLLDTLLWSLFAGTFHIG